MPKGFYVKTTQTGNWKSASGFFVKTSQTAWKSITDAWIKVSPTTWKPFYTAATAPDSPVEILTTTNANGELMLQGKNYHWFPTPSTLQYKFTVVNKENPVNYYDISPYTTMSNPSSGGFAILPASNTYQAVTAASGNYFQGATNVFQFKAKGTTSAGGTFETKAEYEMRIPDAPTLTTTVLGPTSIQVDIKAKTSADFNATYRYIVYRYDSTAGFVYAASGVSNGLGGYSANVDPVSVTLTGLVSGRQYTIYVLPITGSSGTTTSNYTGYPGVLANAVVTTESSYTFSFGNSLYVGTNGYIGLDAPSSSDSAPSVNGRFLGILNGDLFQSTTDSIWYWSNTSEFRIRWEGYHYNQPSNTRIYEVTFYNNQSYATVYAESVVGSLEGTAAFIKDQVVKTSYPSQLTSGSAYNVYFDGTTSPVAFFGWTSKAKSSMKQVVGLTSGSQDAGYTTIVSATNQSAPFTVGTVPVSGGSGDGRVTTGGTLTVSPTGFTTGTTFTYQWKKSRDYNGLPPINQSTGTSQAVSTVGEYYWCTVTYNNTDFGNSGTIDTIASTVVPAAPAYTLTNNSDGTFKISSVSATGGGNYFGSYAVGTGSSTSISTTSISTDSTITSGAGSVSVVLYAGAFIAGQIQSQINGWESTSKSVTVTSLSIPSNTSTPTLTGNLSVGSTVTFGVGSWSPTPDSYDLRLYRGTQYVSSSETLLKSAGNVTSSTYVITQADYDSTQKYLRVYASATNTAGTSSLLGGQEIGPITAAPVAVPSGGTASISGTAQVGKTISGSTSGWSGSPTSYDLRIVRGTLGVIISETLVASSTTSSVSYTVPAADIGYYYKVFAKASNSGGTATSWASSTEIGPVVAAPSGTSPSNPTVTGNNSLTIGGTFSWGSSTGTTPITYVFSVYGPSGSLQYSTYGSAVSTTSFRPGYDATWAGAGNYTIYVYAHNAYGDSGVTTFTQYMS